MEKRDSVDQKRQRKYESVRRFVLGHRALLTRQGRVVEAWRTYRGRRLGPYFRLAYREHGRQRSIYLGESRELADQVRTLLEDCQACARQQRARQGLRALVRAELKKNKAAWREELAKVGLHLKGSEVRGWRAFLQSHRSSHLDLVPVTE